MIPRLVPLAVALLAVAGCSDRVPAPPASTAAAVSSPSPGAAPSPSPTAAAAARPDAARTIAQLTMLADTIGPRVAGTPGERTAADYIASQFSAGGYAVEKMDFTFEGDRFRAGSVVVGGARFEALTLGGSPGGKVSGPAVYVGLGDAAGIAGRALAGKVAIADRGTLRFEEKYDALTGAGAAAIVVINNQSGSFSGAIGKTVDHIMVGVSDTAGPALKAAAATDGDVTIDVPQSRQTAAINVIARSSASASCTVVVGGHFDSVPSTGGANDNASGTAHVIELARAFASDGLDSGLCFVAFSAEESGLYGSKAFVQRMTKEGALPRVYLNLDVTGIGPDVEVIGTASLQKEALVLATTLGIAARAASLPANTGSDHQSFSEAGVPVVYLSSGDFATIHSPRDVSAAIQQDELQRIGDLAFALVAQLLREVA